MNYKNLSQTQNLNKKYEILILKLIESFSHELRTPLNSAINFLTTCSYDEDSSEYLKENFILPALTSLKM